jgi:hypothetical protein
LDQTVFFLNIQPSDWRKLSPFEIVFCTKPNLPLDFQVRFDKGEPSMDSDLDSNMDNHLINRFNLSKQVSSALSSAYQMHTNSRLQKLALPFSINQLVWKRNHTAKGLDFKFIGPYKVIEISLNSALLEHSTTKELTRSSCKDMNPASDLREECKEVRPERSDAAVNCKPIILIFLVKNAIFRKNARKCNSIHFSKILPKIKAFLYLASWVDTSLTSKCDDLC